MKNPVCVHFHIFKNAGSTMEWIFKKNFSENAISIDSNDPLGMLHFENILEILEKKPETKSISSHQFRFPIYNNIRFEFIPIVFLRQPIDRAISIYYFQRRRTKVVEGSVKAKELDLNGYIKWCLETKDNIQMKNFQVLYLSDKPLLSIIDKKDYKIALQRIKESKIIGIVDRFDESLVVAEEILHEYFPNIDLSYIKQNISNGKNLEQISKEEMIEESVLKELYKKNDLDLKIYSQTNHELNKRIQNVQGFGSKLIKFKERCKKLY